MRYKFLTNLILVLLLNFLVKPFWIFGIDRTVQETVGAEEYGSYYALFGFSFLFNILLDFGLTNFNNKNIAQNNDLLTKHFSGILSVKMLLGFLYFLVSGIIALIIGYSTNQLMLLAVLFFNQFLVSLILYLRSNISGLHFFKTDSIISIMDRLLMIIFCGIILWSGFTKTSMSIKIFVFAQTCAYFLTFLTAFFIVVYKSNSLSFNWSFPFSYAIIKKSLPYAILILLMTLYTKIDAVMLERLLVNGKKETGIYAQSYRLLEALNMIAFLFAGLLLPMFSKMLSKNEDIKALTSLALKLLVFPATVLVFGCFLFSYDIMDLLYSTNVMESSQVFNVLILTFIPVTLGYIFGTLLTANGNLKQLNYISITALFLNVFLNYLLIPIHGAYGAAIATVITQSLAVLIQIAIAKQIFNFRLNNINYLKTGGLFFLFWVVFAYHESFPIGWSVKFVVIIFMLLLYGLVVQIINIKTIYIILKEKE